MSHGPGGPPLFGGPQQQPPGPSGLPPNLPPGPQSGAYPIPAPPAEPRESTGPVGPARLAALAAGGLGGLIYLLGFLPGGSGLGSAYLLGGGLLAAASVLPKVGRVLLPGAIIVLVGALGLLQSVTGSGSTSGVLIVGLILAILQAAAAVGAYLLDSGLVKAPATRPAGNSWGPPQPGYGPQGYHPGPSGFGPPPPAPGPSGPPPMFGPQPGAQPGWGPPPPQPPSPTGDVPRSPGGPSESESRADTSTNSFALTSPGKDRPKDRAGDETSVFNDGGGMFTESTPSKPEPASPTPPPDVPAPTTVIPIVSSGGDAKDRAERSPSRSSDQTSVFGDGGMFTESTPRHTSESTGEGRHEKPGEPEWKQRKAVPPAEQTWFMPPEDRPSN